MKPSLSLRIIVFFHFSIFFFITVTLIPIIIWMLLSNLNYSLSGVCLISINLFVTHYYIIWSIWLFLLNFFIFIFTTTIILLDNIIKFKSVLQNILKLSLALVIISYIRFLKLRKKWVHLLKLASLQRLAIII